MVVRARRRQSDAGPWRTPVDESLARVVAEGPWRFLVNFTDDADPGFFLDHRLTRRMIGDIAAGKRVLILFAHTGSATVYAAGGGADSTTSVEASARNIDRAERNLALNRLSGRNHVFVHADVLAWLREASSKRRRARFDLIVVDVPSSLRDAAAGESFEVQRDHVRLLVEAARLLSPEGTIIFSTRVAKFRLDREAMHDFLVEDLSRSTLPRDFERTPRIHSVFRLKYIGRTDDTASPRPGPLNESEEASHG
jgi:23S rRNA (guanine2445-N2)-methyltransferase / 23S rRNA (guanine2069-N7)-methyltransferase